MKQLLHPHRENIFPSILTSIPRGGRKSEPCTIAPRTQTFAWQVSHLRWIETLWLHGLPTIGCLPQRSHTRPLASPGRSQARAGNCRTRLSKRMPSIRLVGWLTHPAVAAKRQALFHPKWVAVVKRPSADQGFVIMSQWRAAHERWAWAGDSQGPAWACRLGRNCLRPGSHFGASG